VIKSDTRLIAASQDPNRARALLNELHMQIMVTRDRLVLEDLLATYLALANSGRVHTPTDDIQRGSSLHRRMEESSKLMNQLSNIMKLFNDNAKSIINNLK